MPKLKKTYYNSYKNKKSGGSSSDDQIISWHKQAEESDCTYTEDPFDSSSINSLEYFNIQTDDIYYEDPCE